MLRARPTCSNSLCMRSPNACCLKLIAFGDESKNKQNGFLRPSNKGIATRSKDATRGSWPYYWEQEATRNKGIATTSKVPSSILLPSRVLVASLLLVAMPFVPSSFLLLVAMPGATSSLLLQVAMPLLPIGLCSSKFWALAELLLAIVGSPCTDRASFGTKQMSACRWKNAPSTFLLLAARMLLVAMPFAPSLTNPISTAYPMFWTWCVK